MGLSAVRNLALCAGIGGLEMGVKLAVPDSRTVCFVERDPFCQRILAARMRDGALDDCPIWDDLLTFDATEWRGRVDLITAGIPCQPWSVAGKRRGADDERWLWPVVANIVRAIQPRFVFLENVRGFIRGGLGLVLSDLADLGYRYTYDVFAASDVGASHRRERIFILADAAQRGFGIQPQRIAECSDSAIVTGPSEPMADADGCRLQRERSSWLLNGVGAASRHDTDGCRSARTALEHATGNGRRKGWPESARFERKSTATESDRAVADTECSHVDRRQSEPRWDAQGRITLARTGERPCFPPGPADTDAWRDILARWPDLAPAVESPVRLLAPRLPRGVDGISASRIDQLRALGNAVVPVQAAMAFQALSNRLGNEGDQNQ